MRRGRIEVDPACCAYSPVCRSSPASTRQPSTLSTVSRLASRWESEGVVETGRGWILFLRPDLLRDKD